MVLSTSLSRAYSFWELSLDMLQILSLSRDREFSIFWMFRSCKLSILQKNQYIIWQSTYGSQFFTYFQTFKFTKNIGCRCYLLAQGINLNHFLYIKDEKIQFQPLQTNKYQQSKMQYKLHPEIKNPQMASCILLKRIKRQKQMSLNIFALNFSAAKIINAVFKTIRTVTPFCLFQFNSKTNNFYSPFKTMAKKHECLLLLTILSSAFSLHFLGPSVQHFEVDKQLMALRDQQSAFQKQIVGLIDDIKSVEAKVNASASTSQKVIILQNAIISERQKIFQLQNSIVPPFNLSKTACRSLTDDQKIKMLDQLQKAKDQVGKLKAIAAKLTTNSEVTSVNSDIAKQETVLDGIQKAIYAKCDTSVVFTPTIFQSNLFAQNWILGKQTIEDIVQNYYQRSRLYQNVTNCPTNLPFFDGTKCISCEQPSPIFNMQLSLCEKCPFDTKLNTDKRVCEQTPHYTDFKTLQNYILDGAALPASPTTTSAVTPCPSLRPYFDGTCVQCSVPSYWNVKQNKCKGCPAGQIFNTNTKTCSVPQGDALSYLEGTSRWVTSPENFANILKERAELLKSHPDKYRQCGKDSPYFDGVSCISCPSEFSLAEKKCVTAPAGSVYNPNLHAYIVPQSGKETNPSASNLLSPAPLPQPKNPCDLQKPYYDGIACIQCPDMFPLFDTTSKKCVRCSAIELYDKATLKCTQRPVTFISSNFNDLMGTPKTDLNSYKAELSNKVKNNGDNIIKQCSPDQYSNFTDCFKCQKGQKFNIQTKKCDTCDGTVDPATLTCDPKTTLLTNLGANNLIVGPNSTLKTYLQAQNQAKGPIVTCPNDQPYSVGGSKCISCPDPDAPYFDLQGQKCVKCAANVFFNSVSHRCQKEINITNIAAVKRSIEVDNYTVANLKKYLDVIAKTRKTSLCPEATPIATTQGDKCIACDNLAYLNLKTNECVLGLYVSNLTALKATQKLIQLDGVTLQLLQAEANAIVQPKVVCPAQKPLWNNENCIGCQANEYYHLKNLACYQPKFISNFQALQKTNNVFQLGNFTLKAQQEDIKKSGLPTKTCAPETPLFDGSKCIGCTVEQFYSLEKKMCLNATVISNTDAITLQNNYIDQGNATLVNLAIAAKKVPQPKRVCASNQPLYNGSKCISCKQSLYNISSLQCANCAAGYNYEASTHTCLKKPDYIPNINNSLWVVSSDSGVAAVRALVAERSAINGSQKCPEDMPHFNNNSKSCESCAKDAYWNYETFKCTTCAAGEQVAPNSRKCLKRVVGKFQTNLNSKNLLFDGIPTAQLQEEYDSNKQKYPEIQDCPPEKPYFDGFQCIKCSVGSPQFSVLKKLCQPCPPNSIYVEQNKFCYSGKESKTSTPNAGKMYSSIF